MTSDPVTHVVKILTQARNPDTCLRWFQAVTSRQNLAPGISSACWLLDDVIVEEAYSVNVLEEDFESFDETFWQFMPGAQIKVCLFIWFLRSCVFVVLVLSPERVRLE